MDIKEKCLYLIQSLFHSVSFTWHKTIVIKKGKQYQVVINVVKIFHYLVR